MNSSKAPHVWCACASIFLENLWQVVDTRSKETQALALAPTRELAEQSRHVRCEIMRVFSIIFIDRSSCLIIRDQVVMAFGDLMNVRCHACIGGKAVGEDIRTLEAGVQVCSNHKTSIGNAFLFLINPIDLHVSDRCVFADRQWNAGSRLRHDQAPRVKNQGNQDARH